MAVCLWATNKHVGHFGQDALTTEPLRRSQCKRFKALRTRGYFRESNRAADSDDQMTNDEVFDFLRSLDFTSIDGMRIA